MIYIILTIVCVGIVFSLNKLYQLKFFTNASGLSLFAIVPAVFSWAFYFALNGFKMGFSSVTFLFGLLYALTSSFNNIIGLIIMKRCKMSLYMSFLMIGGMFLPFLYGVIFLSESFTFIKALALMVLVVALVLPAMEKTDEKTSKLGLFLCVLVFISNGLLSAFSKMHQIDPSALSTNDFMLWANLFSAIFSSLVFGIYGLRKKLKEKKEGEKDGQIIDLEEKAAVKKNFFQAILLLLIISLVNAVGVLFNLTGAKIVDASMLYPMITGGTIVLTSLSGWIVYKEKSTPLSIVSVFIALIGTILFAF